MKGKILEMGCPFALGMQAASSYFPWLMREDRDGVRQSVQLAVLQAPPNDIKALNRAVGRELYYLAYDLGWRRRAFRLGLNEFGQRWEKLVIAEGLVPRTLQERKNYARDMRLRAKSIRR